MMVLLILAISVTSDEPETCVNGVKATIYFEGVLDEEEECNKDVKFFFEGEDGKEELIDCQEKEEHSDVIIPSGKPRAFFCHSLSIPPPLFGEVTKIKVKWCNWAGETEYIGETPSPEPSQEKTCQEIYGYIDNAISALGANKHPLLDEKLIKGLIKKESSYHHYCFGQFIGVTCQEGEILESWAGALGLMQLTPTTAAEPYVNVDPYDAKDNVKGGVKYLNWLLNTYFSTYNEEDGNRQFALAAYNCGQENIANAIRKYCDDVDVAKTDCTWETHIEPHIDEFCQPETKNHVNQIMGWYDTGEVECEGVSPTPTPTTCGEKDQGICKESCNSDEKKIDDDGKCPSDEVCCMKNNCNERCIELGYTSGECKSGCSGDEVEKGNCGFLGLKTCCCSGIIAECRNNRECEKKYNSQYFLCDFENGKCVLCRDRNCKGQNCLECGGECRLYVHSGCYCVPSCSESSPLEVMITRPHDSEEFFGESTIQLIGMISGGLGPYDHFWSIQFFDETTNSWKTEHETTQYGRWEDYAVVQAITLTKVGDYTIHLRVKDYQDNSVEDIINIKVLPLPDCIKVEDVKLPHGNPEDKIDIVFVPKNYDDLSKFASDVETHIYDGFGRFQPISFYTVIYYPGEYDSKFNFYRVDSLIYDDSKGIDAASSCPNDFIIVLDDKVEGLDLGYAGSRLAVVTSDDPKVTVHEVGHLLGLADEYAPLYVFFPSPSKTLPIGTSASQMVHNPLNCDPTPGCPKWCSGPSLEPYETQCTERKTVHECLEIPESFTEEEIPQLPLMLGADDCIWLDYWWTGGSHPFFETTCVEFRGETNIGTDCLEGTGCYFGCGGPGGWRPSQASNECIMDGRYTHKFCPVCTRYLEEYLSNY